MRRNLLLPLSLCLPWLRYLVWTASAEPNYRALKGLRIRANTVRIYDNRTDSLKIVRGANRLSSLSSTECFTPYLELGNDKNSKISATVRLEVSGQENYSVDWDTVSVPSKGYWYFYVYNGLEEAGSYTCTWYIDDEFIDEKTFYIQ